MFYVREIAEKFLSTLLPVNFQVTLFRMHVRAITAEKEFEIAIQMTLEHVLVQRSKQVEIDEKSY